MLEMEEQPIITAKVAKRRESLFFIPYWDDLLRSDSLKIGLTQEEELVTKVIETTGRKTKACLDTDMLKPCSLLRDILKDSTDVATKIKCATDKPASPLKIVESAPKVGCDENASPKNIISSVKVVRSKSKKKSLSRRARVSSLKAPKLKKQSIRAAKPISHVKLGIAT